MHLVLIAVIVFGFSTVNSIAAVHQDSAEKAVYQILESHTREEYREKFKKQHKRLPALFKNSESVSDFKETSPTASLLKSAAVPNPSIRFPAEFEEVQGIFISWPYVDSVIDVVSNSDYAYTFARLADGIQKGKAKVYINIAKGKDSLKVKSYMDSKGFSLTNYRFLIESLDDIWARDFGPVSYYYGPEDSIGWIDMTYYLERKRDDSLPTKWAKTLKYPRRKSPLVWEGGNIMMDGRGKMVTSSSSMENNKLGNKWNEAETMAKAKELFNLKELEVLPYLPNDGGTGQVDLYLDLFDENTYVFAKFPEAMKTASKFPDYAIAAKNLTTLYSRKALENKPYIFRFLPTPPKDNGKWYSSGGDYDNFTRTFVNHLIVNKTIIQPIFHDEKDGNKNSDDSAIALIKKHYPGYSIYPIDMRAFDGLGGSIHCITKELPATNPVTIHHYAYTDDVEWLGSFPFKAEIHNKSGIASAELKYRKKGAISFTSVPLIHSGEAKEFVTHLNFGSNDTVEYFISATPKNGKTMTKPMTADQGGYYSFSVKGGSTAIAAELKSNENVNFFIQKENVSLTFPLNVNVGFEVKLLNSLGQKVESIRLQKMAKPNAFHFNISRLSPGSYFCLIQVNGKEVSFRVKRNP